MRRKVGEAERIVRRFKQCPACGAPFKRRRGRVRCPLCATERQRFQLIALAAVRSAQRLGQLAQQPCDVCGNPKTDAHHINYSRPLDVRWLCRKHHRLLHAADPSAGQIGTTGGWA